MELYRKIHIATIYVFIQSFSPRLKLQRRTVCFLVFTNPCKNKLVSFFILSLNKQLKDHNLNRRLNLTLGSSNFKSFRSSLQSHPVWVTLYNLTWTHNPTDIFTKYETSTPIARNFWNHIFFNLGCLCSCCACIYHFNIKYRLHSDKRLY